MKKLTLSILAAVIAALTLVCCSGETANTTSGSSNSADPAATTTQAPAQTSGTSSDATTATTQSPVITEPEGPEFGNLFYSIDCDITLVDGNAGIAFSGLSKSDFLMWQLAIGEYDDGNLYLRPHYWLSGSASCFEEIVLNEQEGLENISVEYGTAYHMTIRVSDTGVIETLINNVSVYTTDWIADLLLPDEVGLIGFRCAAYNGGSTPEIGIFDNLKIADASGKVLYEDDFSDENSFLCSQLVDGNQAVLEDGAIRITGNLQGYVGLVDITALTEAE